MCQVLTAPDDNRGHDCQNDTPSAHCGLCGSEIYKGDIKYQWESEDCDLCEDCFRAKLDSLSLHQIATMIGLKVERAT